MGLDMYLTATRYMWKAEEDTRKKVKKALGSQFEPTSVSFEAMYWRKANAIHKWFVDNVQGGEDKCREHEVCVRQLEELCSLLYQMLHMPQEEAVKLLPTQEGFFFGGTEYDEWYWDEVERTHERLNAILSDPELNSYSFTYQSSW